MNSFTRHLVFFLSLSLLAVPFIYNSCQGKGFKSASFFGSNEFSSNGNSTCKVMMDQGLMKKVDTSNFKPAAFTDSKVRLHDASSSGLQKATDNKVAHGSELSVILNNACLAQNSDHSSIVNEILRDNAPHADL